MGAEGGEPRLGDGASLRARYMAGAVPPQSLVVYAPRDGAELAVATRIAEAAQGYAMGRIGDLILPDTRW